MTGFKEEFSFTAGAVVTEVVPGVIWAGQGPAKFLPLSREAPVKVP